MSQEKVDLRSEDEEYSSPYDTIIEIPYMAEVPPLPAYDDPAVVGILQNGDPDFPPPAYVEKPCPPLLGYADFLPKCIFPGDAVACPIYDDLKTLMTVANNWLSANCQYTVIRCESIERKVGKNGQLETETMIRFEGINTNHHYVRGIRLWLKKNMNGSPVQRLWYINVVPQLIETRGSGMCLAMMGPSAYGHMARRGIMINHGGYQRYPLCQQQMMFPCFENLDEILKKLNDKLSVTPIPGHIMTVETIDMKYAAGFNWKEMNPDECSWSEKASIGKLFLSVLRIFFVVGPPEKAEIDIIDFAPLCQTVNPGVLNKPVFESLSDTIQRVGDWLQTQNDKRIINIQTITTKLQNNWCMDNVQYDTRQMNFTMGFGDATFIKVIRVPFVRTLCKTNLQLTSKIFVPVRYDRNLSETTSQTLQRINQWLSCTGVEVFGVDTLEYEFIPQNHNGINTDCVRSTVKKGHSHYWISAIRLYIDGTFIEPPEEVLPSVPAFMHSASGEYPSACCSLM